MLQLYNILSACAVLAYAPWIFFKKGPENRTAFVKERFGMSRYIKTDIWVHAVSVGEVIACLPFLKELKKEFPDKKITLSTTTYTGQEIARRDFPDADRIMYVPVDTGICAGRVARELKPELFITVETELWPVLMNALKREGCNIIVLNGRISEKSFKGYKLIRFFMKTMLANIDYFYMQSDADAERIELLGAAKEKVSVMGNFKFDIKLDSFPPLKWLERIHGKIFLAASTHDGEDEIILDAFLSIKKKYDRIRLIIAPRHPERFNNVAEMIDNRGINYIRRSNLTDERLAIDDALPDVILLDTIGELSRAFSKVSVAFIGGSLVPVGGHNILEPAYWSRPVIFGPYMNNFPVAKDFIEGSAAVQVNDAHDMSETVTALLLHDEKAEDMGMNAKDIIDKNTGAVQRALELVRRLIGTA
ncbi:MAG: 3-deoxy-D-manno-octulosonic acid transferase [Nitrospiraceae bacterium]|nr:MAG: 3-deoxy-D-manno-octulosonic acid transferase [Nitrospiraceae bacterium]